ncbi:MAG TPA: periplasmic heavy metal sensor [Candidatus Binataceae bacterium]|nr:periplasmic heavy metal sensor [Candidatus Binataceae bacterium]
MRRKRWFLTLGLMAILALPLPALAFGPHGMGPGGGDGMMPMMMLLHHVNLTADQQSQIQQIMQANWQQSKPLVQQLRSIHEQMANELLSSGTVTAANFTTLQNQEEQVRQQLDANMLNTALKVRGVLTSDQLAQAATLHSKLVSLHQQMEALLGNDEPPPPAE